jgi:hypothetical protein
VYPVTHYGTGWTRAEEKAGKKGGKIPCALRANAAYITKNKFRGSTYCDVCREGANASYENKIKFSSATSTSCATIVCVALFYFYPKIIFPNFLYPLFPYASPGGPPPAGRELARRWLSCPLTCVHLFYFSFDLWSAAPAARSRPFGAPAAGREQSPASQPLTVSTAALVAQRPTDPLQPLPTVLLRPGTQAGVVGFASAAPAGRGRPLGRHPTLPPLWVGLTAGRWDFQQLVPGRPFHLTSGRKVGRGYQTWPLEYPLPSVRLLSGQRATGIRWLSRRSGVRCMKFVSRTNWGASGQRSRLLCHALRVTRALGGGRRFVNATGGSSWLRSGWPGCWRQPWGKARRWLPLSGAGACAMRGGRGSVAREA